MIQIPDNKLKTASITITHKTKQLDCKLSKIIKKKKILRGLCY